MGILPATGAEQPTVQDQAMDFIENALPVDLSKYHVTFEKESALGLSTNEAIHTVRYSLNSDNSTVRVIINIQNNAVLSCTVTEANGSTITDKPYPDLPAAVKGFLEKYQTYSKMDSTQYTAMLDRVDVTKNTTITEGNIKFTVVNTLSGSCLTYFEWVYTANGADYTSLKLGFQKDGSLGVLRDDRAVYSIGDTAITISSEQAIDIALKSLPTYSYEMPGHTMVSGFNVTRDKIVTKLDTSPVNLELRPYWDIRMPLNQTCPGSVQGITVFIWAGTGEIISYSNIAFGGADYNDTEDPAAPETTESPAPTEDASPSPSETTTSAPQATSPTPSAIASSLAPSESTANNPTPTDANLIIAIVLVAIALVTASIILKKRK
jgi:hypothetical protein